MESESQFENKSNHSGSVEKAKTSIEATLISSHLPDKVVDKLGEVINTIEAYIDNETQDQSFLNTFHIEFKKNDGNVVEGDISDHVSDSEGKITISVRTEKEGEYSGHEVLTTIEFKKLEGDEYEIHSDADQFEDRVKSMGFVKYSS